MTPASRVRMHRLLDVWSAGGTDLYDLLAIDHKSGLDRYRAGWDREQFDRARRFISRLNASGSSIFVRPSHQLDAHPWILIDKVTDEGLALIEKVVPPAAVLQSALKPDDFQAWVRIQPAMQASVRDEAARFVANLVGASGTTSYSWLPGTTDRGTECAPAEAVFPFVRLRFVNRNAWTPMETLEREHGFSCAELAEVSAPLSASALAARRRSDRDFAVAMRLIECGQSDVGIRAALEHLWTGAHDAGRDENIRRTIRAARERAHRRTPSGQARLDDEASPDGAPEFQ